MMRFRACLGFSWRVVSGCAARDSAARVAATYRLGDIQSCNDNSGICQGSARLPRSAGLWMGNRGHATSHRAVAAAATPCSTGRGSLAPLVSSLAAVLGTQSGLPGCSLPRPGTGLHLSRSVSTESTTASSAPDATDVDCVVIGAGVIGLACARALARRGQEVVVVEAASAIGTETSSRHSEVIHAGIYYPLGSLKARMCVEGKARLYDFCKQYGVPYKQITKLIVATSKDQLPDLDAFKQTAARHGVPDLQRLSGAEAQQLEPALAAHGALLSPSTGILDSHAYMAALLADAEAHGAVLALNTRVVGGWEESLPQTAIASAVRSGGGNHSSSAGTSSARGPVPRKVLELHTRVPPADGSGASAAAQGLPDVEISRLRARWVVNAAGLHAVRVASTMACLPRSSIPRLYLAKGNYFSLAGRCPFGRLIYPMPERGLAGLGTHLTLDMAGGARFGPDVEWLPEPGPDPGAPIEIDYKVDPGRAASFYPAIRRFFPALPDGALQPAYSGCRPKLSGPGQPAADFLVQAAGGGGGHGLRGWVNMYGIESPGLTSSLALAEHVAQLLHTEA